MTFSMVVSTQINVNFSHTFHHSIDTHVMLQCKRVFLVKIQPPCVCVLLSWREYLESLVRHECFATFVLSIPEGVVEHRTSVHPFRAFMSIWHDCVDWCCRCMEGWMSRQFVAGARSRGALPLHQVMQR